MFYGQLCNSIVPINKKNILHSILSFKQACTHNIISLDVITGCLEIVPLNALIESQILNTLYYVRYRPAYSCTAVHL
jgi:hypothetical protein